jgi:hypothetical protein
MYPVKMKSEEMTELHLVLVNKYGSLRQAAIKLKYRRATLYTWIYKGYIPDNAFKRWKAEGVSYRGLTGFRRSK